MGLESTDNIAMVYETLKNIDIAITRLQERSKNIHSVNDYLQSPNGIIFYPTKGSAGGLIWSRFSPCELPDHTPKALGLPTEWNWVNADDAFY